MEIGSNEWKALIRTGALQLGLSLDGAVLERFSLHAGELLRWNRRFNLTAITEPSAVAVKHYIDSVAPAGHIPPGTKLLDLGTGGGFPGIPLKILDATLRVTLVESSRKKVSFLKHAARCLALELQILEMRSEAVPPAESGGGFEVVVSRALASLEGFFEMALPLVARGGRLLAWKGNLSEAELSGGIRFLQNTAAISPEDITVLPYTLPLFEEVRRLVLVKVPR